jgi:hypothetical protein
VSEIGHERPDDRALPPGVHLPRPTVWPASLALGIVLLFSGFVLGFAFSLAGLVVAVISIAGWIRELLRE